MRKAQKLDLSLNRVSFEGPSIQVTWKALLTGGCLLLNESSAESSCMSFLHYFVDFHAAISNHLSEKPKLFLVVYSGLTQV